MYARVLLTTDGSPSSLAAIPHAAELIDRETGEVHVLEVIDALPKDVARELEIPPGQGLEQLDLAMYESAWWHQRAVEHVERARNELERLGVRHVVPAVRAGDPVPAIVAYARAEGCQAVVMSTHGRTGLRRVLLGSVAEGVLNGLQGIPLLLLRPPPGTGTGEHVH